MLKEETADNGKLFAFGDSLNVLQFSVGSMAWTKIEIDKNSGPDGKPVFEGKLRYMASCYIPDKKILVTGGSNC